LQSILPRYLERQRRNEQLVWPVTTQSSRFQNHILWVINSVTSHSST